MPSSIGGSERTNHEAWLLPRNLQPLRRVQADSGQKTREIVSGLNVDLDTADDVVGFDIDHASKLLDLSTLEAESLPLRNAARGTRNDP